MLLQQSAVGHKSDHAVVSNYYGEYGMHQQKKEISTKKILKLKIPSTKNSEKRMD